MTTTTTTITLSLDEAVARIIANHGMSTTTVRTAKSPFGDTMIIGLVCNATGQTFEMAVTETTETDA